MIRQIIRNELERYNLQLSDNGIDCIETQVKLLYGNNPTISQIRKTVGDNQISFMDEMKRVEEVN